MVTYFRKYFHNKLLQQEFERKDETDEEILWEAQKKRKKPSGKKNKTNCEIIMQKIILNEMRKIPQWENSFFRWMECFYTCSKNKK